jgi:membrane fusion protein
VLAYGERRSLEAGMRVEADIALEKRSLYRWLLDPVAHVRESLALVTRGGLDALPVRKAAP